jgi:hypothetical protein
MLATTASSPLRRNFPSAGVARRTEASVTHHIASDHAAQLDRKANTS